jgi:hypothetical protein
MLIQCSFCMYDKIATKSRFKFSGVFPLRDGANLLIHCYMIPLNSGKQHNVSLSCPSFLELMAHVLPVENE